MANDAKAKAMRELSTTLMSVRVHEFMATYFDILLVRIMEGAARQANARRKKGERELITVEELLQSARELLQDAPAELERLLADEKTHATPRKRAS